MNLSEPVGEYLKAPRPGKIVGVVKDFHSSELRGPIEPVIIAMRPDETNRVFIRYEGASAKALQLIGKVYKKYEPDFPMEYSFMDEPFNRLYKDELTIGRLSSCFTVIAIFISFLGLTGLASFTAERRTREIGIRKVMGATIQGIILLLCKDFVKLMILSIVVGFVVGYYMVSEFLSRYTFHFGLNAWIFIFPAVILLVLTLVTVSIQSIKVALTDPTRTLKTE